MKSTHSWLPKLSLSKGWTFCPHGFVISWGTLSQTVQGSKLIRFNRISNCYKRFSGLQTLPDGFTVVTSGIRAAYPSSLIFFVGSGLKNLSDLVTFCLKLQVRAGSHFEGGSNHVLGSKFLGSALCLVTCPT